MDKQRTLPELLAPAGDMERLKMAVLYGADAVYLAGTDFGMRAFAGNFDPDELKAAVAYAFPTMSLPTPGMIWALPG